MRNIAGARALYSVQAQTRADVIVLMEGVVSQLGRILGQYADAQGSIPLRVATAVQRDVGEVIEAQFSRGREVFGADGVTALTPYAALLNRRLAQVVAAAVDAHARYMEKHLPDELKSWLRLARPLAGEQVNMLNPLAQYEAAHTWVDPRGYQLSGRIWRAGQATRLQVDQLLADGIRRGRGALALARDLEKFLVPGARSKRTDMPYGAYGRNASYHAMVLARTEISRAHSQATFAASRANPFVSGMDWALSARHPKFDICDGLATIGMGGQRLHEPYPLESAPMVVVSSHPQCICTNRPAVTENEADVIAALRRMVEAGEPPNLTPLARLQMLNTLLGNYLTQLALEWV